MCDQTGCPELILRIARSGYVKPSQKLTTRISPMCVFSDLPIPLQKLITEKIRTQDLTTPQIIISEKAIRYAFAAFLSQIPAEPANIHFPVKVNNHPEVLRLMDALGSGFEIASAGELKMLIEAGIAPERIIFSNPVKITSHISEAYDHGIRDFAFDSLQELKKISKYAPACKVHLRLAISNEGAEWKLDAKFGASPQDAIALMRQAVDQGLSPSGISFHAGWNNTNIMTWESIVRTACDVVRDCFRSGIDLEFINIGGGFPAHLHDQNKYLQQISEKINPLLNDLINDHPVKIKAEPGSFVCANSAAMMTRITDIVERNEKKWAFMDTGIFQGFYWITGNIHYPVIYPSELNHELSEYTVTGPTCDSHDVFFHRAQLPTYLKSGDILIVWPAGAYISSAKNYNGYCWPDSFIY